MAYVIAESCFEPKDTACVDACPVDYIHRKKTRPTTMGCPGFGEVPQLYEPWGYECRDGQNGWLRRGGLAVLEEEEYCNIIGRAKDILCGGGNVYQR